MFFSEKKNTFQVKEKRFSGEKNLGKKGMFFRKDFFSGEKKCFQGKKIEKIRGKKNFFGEKIQGEN